MKKHNLKDGMVVEVRNGTRYMFISEINMFVGDKFGLDVTLFNNELSFDDNYFKGYSVDKVFNPIKRGCLSDILSESDELVWERKDVEKLTHDQYDKLKALLTLGYHWVAKEESGIIYAYDSEPFIGDTNWLCNDDYTKLINLELPFIKCEESEPRSIEELLKLEVR